MTEVPPARSPEEPVAVIPQSGICKADAGRPTRPRLARKMRIYCLAVVSLFPAACDETKNHDEAPHVAVLPSYPDHFEGAWVMSAGWMGYMGVALALSGDRYYYWMYSDIPIDASYPYTGTFRIEGDTLLLGAPTVLATGESAAEMPESGLYNENWHIIREGLSLRLHSTSDAPEDHNRTLYPDFGFDPQNPFKNQEYMKNLNRGAGE